MSVEVEEPKKKRSLRRDYTPREIDAALKAWVWVGGHRDKAQELLKEQGYEIPAQTIWYWANRKASTMQQLEVIRAEEGPKIKAYMAEVHQGLANAAAEIEAKSIVRLNEKLDANQVEAKDLSAIMQRAAIATGIHSEKHLLYSGQPTSIVQRELSEVFRALRAKGLEVDVIEGTATEEPDGSPQP